MWKYELFDLKDENDDTNFILSTVNVDADDEGRPQDYGHSILEGLLIADTDKELEELAKLIASAPELKAENERLKERLSKYESVDNFDESNLPF